MMTRSRCGPHRGAFAGPPVRPFVRLSVGLVSAILASLFSGSATLQASLVGLTWNANKAASYGYLWQYSLAPPLGAAACGPAATTNAFTFLQNTQGERIGNVLTGNDYGSWKTTANTLANDYMQTGESGSAHPGTSYLNLAKGMEQYAQHKHEQYPDRTGVRFNGLAATDAFEGMEKDAPHWVELLGDKGPTLEQLYQMLAGGAGVVMGMNQLDSLGEPQVGHIVTLAGMDWNDENKNGIVDRGEATLSVIDPLDPSSNVENGNQNDPYGSNKLTPQRAEFTTLHVWQDEYKGAPCLAVEYMQYHGSDQPSGGRYGKYNPENYETTNGPLGDHYLLAVAFSMRAVPDPASVLVWSSLVLGVTLTRRRRMA